MFSTCSVTFDKSVVMKKLSLFTCLSSLPLNGAAIRISALILLGKMHSSKYFIKNNPPNEWPTKVTSSSRNGMSWKKMLYYFQLNNEDFLQHYHSRSNAETSVHMIKSKFGDFVRSKIWTAQINEVLCKVICHNICVIIQEMHELGISPDFKTG